MNPQIKYSIIIPTYNKLEKYLKPCIDSVIKNTDWSNKELIVVSNGCTDGTYEWLQQLDLPYLKFYRDENPLGYAKAINRGYELSEGEYLILLNNDTLIQDSPLDHWVTLLQQPFDKFANCGLSGPVQNYQDKLKFFFIVFCCVMIKRNVFDEVGWMNEIDYPIGSGEDVEFSYKALKKGYTSQLAPYNSPIYKDSYNIFSSVFPLIHYAEGTVHDPELVPNWEETFWTNMTKVSNKFLEYPKQQVLAEVCTKDRYTSTLPITLQSILNQTIKPKALIILDNSTNRVNMTEIPTIKYLLDRFMAENIQWYIVWGDQLNGQHLLHEIGQNKAKELNIPLVWRVDDDTFCEPNVLEELLSYMGPEVGAVAGSVLTPPAETVSYNKIKTQTATTINDIIKKGNAQWVRYVGPAVELQHFYCSFLYRVGISNYDLNLSPVAHREETLFSYSIFRKGYKLILNPNAITWHYRNPEGGIRSNDNQSMYQQDDVHFFNRLQNEWGINLINNKKTFFVSNGIGDHFVFKGLIPELKAKYGAFNIACVFPDVFYDIDSDISIVSLQEGLILNSQGSIDYNSKEYNPYALASDDDYNGIPVKNIDYYFRKITGLL